MVHALIQIIVYANLLMVVNLVLTLYALDILLTTSEFALLVVHAQTLILVFVKLDTMELDAKTLLALESPIQIQVHVMVMVIVRFLTRAHVNQAGRDPTVRYQFAMVLLLDQQGFAMEEETAPHQICALVILY